MTTPIAAPTSKPEPSVEICARCVFDKETESGSSPTPNAATPMAAAMAKRLKKADIDIV